MAFEAKSYRLRDDSDFGAQCIQADRISGYTVKVYNPIRVDAPKQGQRERTLPATGSAHYRDTISRHMGDK